MNVSSYNPDIIEEFASAECLPTLPEVASKLIELAQQPEPDFGEVARVISADPVMSGKVMTTVNSALFCFRPAVESIEDAVTKLGLTMIRTLLLSFHLAEHDSDEPEMKPIMQEHWRSSLTQAVFAELIAQRVDLDPSTCFLAAMLQDVGILAMLSQEPRNYIDKVLDRASFPTVTAAEGSVFGVSHVDVSAMIIRRWGLADRFAQAATSHHDEIVKPDDDRLSAVTRVASLGAAVVMSSTNKDLLDESVAKWTECLNSEFGISPEQADEMISEVNALVDEYAGLFCFDIGESLKVKHVVAKAKAMLQEIALANQMELVSNKRISKKNQEDLFRDELTGLKNRRFMNEHLSKLMETAVDKGTPIALLFMDVDRFKSINDNLGHNIGDQAIVHVANWIQESIRKNDHAIRLGGDEFVAILQATTMQKLRTVGQRLAIEIPPLPIDEESLEIQLSVGGIFYRPVEGDEPDANWLIDQADRSMYAAKRSGGGRIVIEQYYGIG